jgi:mRNA-degrading endonuclease RelE of RelBE toxin-antitoxin system
VAEGLTYRPVYEPGARDLIRHLPPAVKGAIKRAIESLRDDPYAGKPLRFELESYRSLRRSKYRVIYRVRAAERVVEIHYFGPRRDVYELFRHLLRGSMRTARGAGLPERAGGRGSEPTPALRPPAARPAPA